MERNFGPAKRAWIGDRVKNVSFALVEGEYPAVTMPPSRTFTITNKGEGGLSTGEGVWIPFTGQQKVITPKGSHYRTVTNMLEILPRGVKRNPQGGAQRNPRAKMDVSNLPPELVKKYREFHETDPQEAITMEIEDYPDKMIIIGKLCSFVYQSFKPSKRAGSLWEHEVGDLGSSNAGTEFLVCAGPDGRGLFLVKVKGSDRYPQLTSRGVVG
ncbi:MAG: hypothetical protein Q8O76_13195 [Chloroflexota bacterium]|nr:hypothetical protein [Chloroflexota bacterium]